jgi:hypothetical protein
MCGTAAGALGGLERFHAKGVVMQTDGSVGELTGASARCR